MKKQNEQNLQDTWDYNQRSNILVIGVPEGKKENRTRKVFLKMAEQSLKFGKRHKHTDLKN